MDPPGAHLTGGGSRDCGAFFLDVVGTFGPGDLTVQWTDRPRASHPHVDQLIERTWAAALKEANGTPRPRQEVFDGPMCRLAHYAAEGAGLALTLGPVSFKEYVGTNGMNAHIRYVYGPEVLADAVGVSTNLITRDGFLLLGRRSSHVLLYKGRLHPVGGALEPPEAPGTVPDPFGAIAAELREETGIGGDAVAEVRCLGLARDKRTVQPELIFDTSVLATVADVRRMSRQADDTDEHSEWVPVRADAAAVVTFIEHRMTELTPIGLAALLLHGLRHWGSGWFAAARGYLRRVV